MTAVIWNEGSEEVWELEGVKPQANTSCQRNGLFHIGLHTGATIILSMCEGSSAPPKADLVDFSGIELSLEYLLTRKQTHLR
jgi:hypothetical protein